MALASFVQTSFVGGKWSKSAQGALTEPAYKTAMNAALNYIPIDTGAVTRRPGTEFLGTTRGGAAGRVIPFDFQEDAPYNMEFTDGYLRFWNGSQLAMTNDRKTVSSISAANPAKVATPVAHGWSTGNSVAFNTLGVNNPLLHRRLFTITVTSSTEFTIADALTGTAIDGSMLGTFVSGFVTRVNEMTTQYTSESWRTLRSVQAELRSVLMNGTQQPQVLEVDTPPLPGSFATFDLNDFDFIDGPYLDPIAGSLATPSALNGLVTITLSTQAYDSTRAYNIDDFVTSSGVTYRSLQGSNVGHTPASSATYWVATNAGAVIGPEGFQTSDIGRLVRFYSEPSLWAVGSSYVSGDKVAYPSTEEGVNLYYTATASISAGVAPGTSTSWSLTPAIAKWTWGRVTAVSGAGVIAPVSATGNMTSGGGVAAAFDGTNTKSFAASASVSSSIDAAPVFVDTAYAPGQKVYYSGNIFRCLVQSFVYNGNPFAYANGTLVTLQNGYYYQVINTGGYGGLVAVALALPTSTSFWVSEEVAPSPVDHYYTGQHYSSAKAIYQATIYPTNDVGFSNATSITFNLRAKATAPSSSSDGTLLGSVTQANSLTTATTIASSDTTTTWNYVWVELVATYTQPLTPDTPGVYTFAAKSSFSQVVFYEPNVANGSVFVVQITGDALLYTTAIRTWRLGVFSDTTGWPKCGTYHEGRLWLSGAVGNRIDGSKSGNIFNFAPTSAGGVVSDANAIAYTFDAEDVNPIFWMSPDQQGIVCGTQAGEWLVQASVNNNPLTPTNIQAHRVTKIKCANIEPRRTEHTLLFLQRFKRKIMEYFPDVYSGKFSAPNLSEKAKDLSVSEFAELAYQQELAPILWARRTDGRLVGMTYKRDSLVSSQGPAFKGWHEHALGSERLVESICVGPSTDGLLDTLAMVTNASGGSQRHVEIMRDLFEETDDIKDAWFLDNAATPSSYAVDTVLGGASGVHFTGLWHLNGETVTVFAGGLDLGEWPVTDGTVQVPFIRANDLFTAAFVSAFNGAMPAVVGYTYLSQGQLLRPETLPEAGSRNGPGFGKVRRIHKFAVALVNTQVISFGTRFTKLNLATLKTTGKTVALAANVLFTGVHKDTMPDESSFDGGQLCWQQTRPFPGTITQLGGSIETTDE